VDDAISDLGAVLVSGSDVGSRTYREKADQNGYGYQPSFRRKIDGQLIGETQSERTKDRGHLVRVDHTVKTLSEVLR
jgi:inosine/xanthosine triphosphate pyrophosphatase family protein